MRRGVPMCREYRWLPKDNREDAQHNVHPTADRFLCLCAALTKYIQTVL